MDEFTIWLQVPQNFKSLEIEKSTLFRVMEKICGVSSFLRFYFHCQFFLGEIVFLNNFSQFCLLLCFNTTVLRF